MSRATFIDAMTESEKKHIRSSRTARPHDIQPMEKVVENADYVVVDALSLADALGCGASPKAAGAERGTSAVSYVEIKLDWKWRVLGIDTRITGTICRSRNGAYHAGIHL